MPQDAHARIDELQHAMEKLTRRVEDIARRVTLLEPESRPEMPKPTPIEAPAEQQATPATAPKPEPIEQTPSAPAPTAVPTPAPTHAPSPAPAHERGERAFRALPPVKKSREFEFDLSKLEWVLGIRGLMLLGVIIVIVGVGMFLKLAHDEGWIAALSPATKCGAAALFGMILVGVGESLRRRISPLASSGFTAAGIAALYASVYAASRVYGLFGVELAFGLLALTTASGIVLGAIGKRVMLSLLSLIGAFAVPLLLSTGEPSVFVLPAYLLLLLSMGLVLSGWKGGHYAHARRLAWWGTGLIGTLWLADMHTRSPWAVIVFVTLAWAMTICELAVSARFFRRLRAGVEWDPTCHAAFRIDGQGNRSFNPAAFLSPEARWVNALFGATIWAVISAGVTLRAQSPDLVFLSPLGFACLSIAIVLVAMRIGRLPRISAEIASASPLSLFLSAVLINTAMLLVATIATGLGGWLEVIAWLSVGLGAIETGRRLRFRAVTWFGGAMLAFAILRLFSYDLYQSVHERAMFSALGIGFGAWGVQVIAACIASALACWRCRHQPEKHVAGSVALWLLACCVFHTETRHGSLGAYWVLLGAAAQWGLLWLRDERLRLTLRINALVMLTLGTLLAVLAQFSIDGAHIDPAQLAMVIGAWVAVAALPRTGFTLRTISAFVGTALAMLAIGRVQSEYSWAAMLLWDAVLLGQVVIAGRWLYRWSLAEIGSSLALLLAFAWGLHAIDMGAVGLQQTPFVGVDSLGSFVILATMLYAGLMLTTLRLASDAIGEVHETRTFLRSTLLGASWIMLLIVSTIEVVRLLHVWFDSGSAQGAGVSIWWSVFAVASVAMGFRFQRALRWSGLGLLCVVAGKVLIFDTTMLAPTARIVASITVGLIIIATGVLYTWLVKRLESAAAAGAGETPPDP